jgi:hypothetical protein
MSVSDEIRRLDEGPLTDEEPGGIGTVTLLGLCEGNAGDVARRVREVLRVVLTSSSGHWPSEGQWHDLLPNWFVAACAPEMSQEVAERWLEKWRAMAAEEKAELDATQRWSLPDWLHWLQPSERQWEFWACEAGDTNSVRLSLKVDAWPLAHGALDWLLRAAGANRVVSEQGD